MHANTANVLPSLEWRKMAAHQGLAELFPQPDPPRQFGAPWPSVHKLLRASRFQRRSPDMPLPVDLLCSNAFSFAVDSCGPAKFAFHNPNVIECSNKCFICTVLLVPFPKMMTDAH
jgi:hypothetical protein